MKTKVKTIKQKVIIPASPKEVYEAYVDPKKHAEFTGAKATGKPVVGGKYTTWDGYAFGKFLELEDGKRVVQEWTTTDWPAGQPPSRLQLTLKKAKDGTELIMVHSGVPAEQAYDIAQGWVDWYWEPLKKYLKKKA